MKTNKFNGSVQKDLCEGINTIYEEMFTDKVYYYSLNTELTDVNVYGESNDRVYNEPISFFARPVINSTQEDEYNKTSKLGGYFTVPMYQFLLKGLSTDKEALEQMKKGAIKFDGLVYQIDDITPLTNIQGMYMVVKIECSEPTTPLILESIPIPNEVI